LANGAQPPGAVSDFPPREGLGFPLRRMSALDRLRAAIRDVPDFPKPGILFKDITPILADGALFRSAIDLFCEATHPLGVTKVVGIDARGFVFGAAIAYHLGIGFVPIRKKGKLPYRCESASYQLEYGEATAEIHVDALQPGERVVLIDDLLATGGTAAAAVQLIGKMNAELAAALFLIELGFLNGRRNLEGAPVRSFIRFD
jgi:adenine phosphoribosyltransferase